MPMTSNPNGLAVAYCHPSKVSHTFLTSWEATLLYDLTGPQQLRASIREECGTARVIDGRNSAVRKFLSTDAEWLAFVDSDMGWQPDAIHRLMAAADREKRPLIGGLCFGVQKGIELDERGHRFLPRPTIYTWHDPEEGQTGLRPLYDYPDNALVRCDATGAAFFVAHRRVFETLAESGAYPYPREWFDDTIYKGRTFSEDITFFLRAREQGFPLYVHTGVKTSHHKETYLTELTVGDLNRIPTFVVIPVKDRLDLTSKLLRQLERQGGYDRLFVFDNGSGKETKNWLSTCDIDGLEVVDADGWNIHQMWNDGIRRSVTRSQRCNIAILNNDLVLGDRFLSGLSAGLRSAHDVAVVCPNYDGRDGSGLEFVEEICAGRYDGTGGLAGFAFMMKGESNYQFPEELSWWYGDTDLLMTALNAGVKAAIVLDTSVEHVDGGSQTGEWDDPEMQKLLEQDAAWFHAKWSRDAA